MIRSIAKPRIRPALRTGVFAVGGMWIASAAFGQGATDPRADTRTQIIAPKYLPGYDPFNPSGFDNPSEPLVLEPGPFDPPPTGGPTADFRELIEFHAADHHAISPLDGAPPLGVPAPGSVLLIALSAAGLAAPRRRSR